MPPLRLLLVAGARPNFMKIAPLIHAIQRHNERLPVDNSLQTPNSELRTPNSHLQSPLSDLPVSAPASRIQHPASDAPPSPPPSVSGFPDSDFSFQLSAFRSQSAPPISHLPSPISYRLVHTGQHYDEQMSEVFFRELGIPAPDINLEVGSGSHAVQTANLMTRFEPVLLHAFDSPTSDLRPPSSDLPSAPPSVPRSAFRNPRSIAPRSDLPSPDFSSPLSAFRFQNSLPDWLIVVGDVNSTMACTLVASKLGVKVAHVEAGLRSFDRTMPEEINRVVTDAISDLLFTPSEDANENLRREGIPEHKIRLVGNIMIDSLVANLPKARASQILQRLGVPPGGYVYVTLHRPSNVDSPDSLRAIMAELKNLAKRMPVVFPMHPRTRKMLAGFGLSIGNRSELETRNSDPEPSLSEFQLSAFSSQFSERSQPSTLDPQPSLLLIDPVGYHDSLCLTENARLVLTDSGGLQEESTWFRTPCLTLRPNTERPVTVTTGSNRLTTLERLRSDFETALNGGARTGAIPPLWDGHTAERILPTLFENASNA